jgi:DNA-binding response OmpR family regulator
MSPTILVVDDEADMLNLLRLILRRGGWQVVTAASGSEALQLADRYLPDLILLDIMMPGLNGHEVCARLRQDARFKQTPILALTAQAHLEEQVRAHLAGIDEYIVKPVAPAELLERVRAHLHPASIETPAPA